MRRSPRRRTFLDPALVTLGVVGLSFLVVPLVALGLRTPWRDVGTLVTDPVVTDALRISLLGSMGALAVAVALGVPLAWLLARHDFPGKPLVRAAATLPMVLPPIVGGVALLAGYGRRGLVGGLLDRTLGLAIPFTELAVTLAAAFVSMPFLVIAVEAGLRSLDHRLEEAGATLGGRPGFVFRRVTLPLLQPSLAAGMLLTWARALGEFGATITFAGNLPGTTQTMPLAIFGLLHTNPDIAYLLSFLLLAVSVTVMMLAGRRFR